MQIFYHIMVFILAVCTLVLWVWLRKANRRNAASLTTHNIGSIENYLEKINKTVENLNGKFWEYDNYLTNIQKTVEEERREIIKLLEKITAFIETEKKGNNYAFPKENTLLVSELSQKVGDLEGKLKRYVQEGGIL
ncbi:hypothetical protein KAI68_00880 [bacterium]|nr:hypothetical protein [bacterium]